MTASDYEWEASGEHRLRDLLQEAIFPSTASHTPCLAVASGTLSREALIRAMEQVTAPHEDPSYGSALNPAHPGDVEAARVWHGLPTGAAVTQQQLWEWLVGVPRL